MRNKLAELLEEAEGLVNNDRPSLEQIADHLIDNGVTIPVRCKDCTWFEIDPDDYLGVCQCEFIATNDGGKIYPERYFFCQYGVRRRK